jgi:hypothetical protein
MTNVGEMAERPAIRMAGGWDGPNSPVWKMASGPIRARMASADAEFARETRRLEAERRHRAEVKREAAVMGWAEQISAERGVPVAEALRNPGRYGRTHAQARQWMSDMMDAEDRKVAARLRAAMRRALAREGLLDVFADTPGEIEIEVGSRHAVREMRENPNLSPERAAQDYIRGPFLRRRTQLS